MCPSTSPGLSARCGAHMHQSCGLGPRQQAAFSYFHGFHTACAYECTAKLGSGAGSVSKTTATSGRGGRKGVNKIYVPVCLPPPYSDCYLPSMGLPGN